MRNFKKILLMIVILIGMEFAASFLLEPISFENTMELEFKALNRQNFNPNMLLLGDSMVVCGLDPDEMETMLGEDVTVLNAATVSQQVWGSYYYLKDLLEQYDVDYVVLGMGYWAYIKEEKAIKSEMIVLNRIKNPLIQLEYCLNILEPKEYPYIFKSYINRDMITNIPENIRQKLKRDYWVRSENLPFTRGHRLFGDGMEESKIGIEKLSDVEDLAFSLQAQEYLDKIYELCREKEVKLYLLSMPMPSVAVYASPSYTDFHDYVQEYASERNIPYWDMNLLKDRYEVIPDVLMSDMHHVSSEGCGAVSQKLGALLRKDINGESVEDEFYSSVQEWKDSVHGIVGCDFHTEPLEGTADRVMIGESIHSEDVEVEYAFLISTESEDGSWTKLQDYGVAEECVIPGEYFAQDVWMKVLVREKGNPDAGERSCVRHREANMGD